MDLRGWTCPACDDYHRQVDGHRRADGALSIRCPTCGEIEVVRKYRQTVPGRAAR